MANLLFLGAFILSYFVYKFLRQFFFVDYHSITNANESFPAIDISAERGEIRENALPYNRAYNTLDSSIPSNTFCFEIAKKREKRSNPKPILVKNPPRFENSYKKMHAEEENDLRKKERLYISALNRGRPRGKPKIRKLPDVGYLPTIFEKLPYPLTSETLRSYVEEESDDMREMENIIEEKPIIIQLEANEREEKQVPMKFLANNVETEPARIELDRNVTLSESVFVQSIENTVEEEPNITSPISKKKKKKFRKIRKFFSRISCIRKVKQ